MAHWNDRARYSIWDLADTILILACEPSVETKQRGARVPAGYSLFWSRQAGTTNSRSGLRVRLLKNKSLRTIRGGRGILENSLAGENGGRFGPAFIVRESVITAVHALPTTAPASRRAEYYGGYCADHWLG